MLTLADITSKYRAQLILAVYQQWIKRGEKVLDIGCGTGVVAKELAKGLNIKVTGCDVYNYLTQDFPFIKMEKVDTLPFPNKSFDIAMFNDVLHHTKKSNQKKLLKEALRVADKVLIFEVKPTFFGKLADYLINKIHYPHMETPFTFRSVKEWERIFKKLGVSYTVEEIKRPLLYPFSHIVFHLKKWGF